MTSSREPMPVIRVSAELAVEPEPPAPSADDIAVLRRVASGDREALGVLYDRYGAVMLALGVRIIGVRREAEDLLHDVFLEAWRHAGDYDPCRASVKGWLFLRMRSRCLDRVRSRAFSRSEAFEVEPMHGAHGTRSAHGAHAVTDTGPERCLDGARAKALLERLPAGQREVLELGYLQGLAFAEIAEVLGIPLGTVKSRVSAAMMKLRAELGVVPEASS